MDPIYKPKFSGDYVNSFSLGDITDGLPMYDS